MIQKVKQLKTNNKLLENFDYLEFTNPDKAYYHLTNNRAKKAEILIEEGDHVKIGDKLAIRDGGFFKQNVISTISGIYIGKEKHLHRTGTMVEYMVIENDHENTFYDQYTNLSLDEMKSLNKEDFINLVHENSNVGLGGSGFPTHIKLQSESTINTVVINGVECEPYLTSDVTTMKKYGQEIIDGLYLLIKFYNAKEGVIAVKAKQKDLITSLQSIIDKSGYKEISLHPTPNYYPQGYERDVIRTVAKVEVKPGSMPADYGFMVFNSTSVLAIHNSLKYNVPLLTREISLIGEGLKKQTNAKVRVGTLITDVIEKIGGYNYEGNDKVLICGGPMMGTALKSDDVVVSRAFSTLIVHDAVEETEQACINCGSCALSCPTGLQPMLINQAMNARNKETIAKLNVKNCIECGLCSYVCTSKIDLTKNMRRSKRMI